MVAFHRDRIRKANDARNQRHRRFDNLSFIQDYYSNEDARNSYLRPKRNDEEVRVVGGTTEKRIESLVNELASMNFQHDIQAYDQEDRLVEDLGNVMEDVVKRTNQMEEDSDVRLDAIYDMLCQRAVFLEEVYERRRTRGVVRHQYRKRLRTSLEVLLGDLTIPHYRLDDQPYIVTYERMSIQAAEQIYGHFNNFKYVRPGMDLSNDVYGSDVTFRLGHLAANEIEICKYASLADDEYQPYICGVPMFPVGSKLPWRYPHYNLSCTVAKGMSPLFFYGRPPAVALKYLQALDDEMIRNIVIKFRQAVAPPKAALSTNKVYSRDIFNAGSITYGLDATTFKDLVDPTGVTTGEIQVLNLIKQMQDEMASRSATNVGVSPGQKQLATQIIEQQKGAVKMLGLFIIAWSRMIRQNTKLRLYNIVEHLDEPITKEIDPSGELVETLQSFTLREETLDDGRQGTKVIKLMDRNLEGQEVEDLANFEEDMAKKGEPVSIKTLNVKALKKLDITWHVGVTSKPEESHDLNKMMFQDKIAQAQAISQIAQRPLNGERVIDEFERTWRLKDWFTEQMASPEQPPPGGIQASPPGESGVKAAANPNQRPGKPSIADALSSTNR